MGKIKTCLSIRLARIAVPIDDGAASLRRNIDSITVNSVEVVSIPTNAHQSFTTIPAATASLPLLTVPACKLQNHENNSLNLVSSKMFLE